MPRGLVLPGQPAQRPRRDRRRRRIDALDVRDDHVAGAGREQEPAAPPCPRRPHRRPRSARRPGPSSTTLSAFVSAASDDDRGAVLVVVEHRDVEPLAQPPLDLEAARRRDVLEVDPRRTRARSARRSRTISSTSWVSRQIGNASMSANRLNSTALPSITGSAAPRADVAQAEHRGAVGDHGDVLRLMVSRRASSGCPAIARQTRATPGCRPSTGRRGCAAAPSTRSILPPRCMRNVRSLTRRRDAVDLQRLHDVLGVLRRPPRR